MATNSRKFKIIQIDDNELLATCGEIARALEVDRLRVICASIQTELSSKDPQIPEASGRSIDRIDFNFRDNKGSFLVERSELGHSTVTVSINQTTVREIAEALKLVGAATSRLQPYVIEQELAGATEVRDNLAEQLRQLIALQADFARKLADAGTKADEKLREKNAVEREKIEESRQAALAEIDLAKAEFETQKKAFDDRRHTHARRQQFETHFEKISQNNAGLSSIFSTSLSAPTAWLPMLLGLSLVSLSAYFLFLDEQLGGSSQNEDIFHYIRGAAFSIAGGLFFVFGLQTSRQIHNQLLRERYQRELYSHDLARANWIVEAIQEVAQEEGATLPDAWIAGASKGLFEGGHAHSREDRAMDAVSALLSYGAKARVGPSGFEAELSPQHARRLGRDVDS